MHSWNVQKHGELKLPGDRLALLHPRRCWRWKMFAFPVCGAAHDGISICSNNVPGPLLFLGIGLLLLNYLSSEVFSSWDT